MTGFCDQTALLLAAVQGCHSAPVGGCFDGHARSRGIFPDRLIDRGVSTMNTSVMLGVACMQTLFGIIIGAFEPLAGGARTEEAYLALFGVMTPVRDRSGYALLPLSGRQAER
jgi:hypothetical protein